MKTTIKTLLVIACMITSLMTFSCTGSSSGSLVGEWKEYRADDPSNDYLISHFEFKSSGQGAYWLTDGRDIRQKFEFSWKKEGTTVYINSIYDEMTLSFNNGLLIENSSFGTIVYKKR